MAYALVIFDCDGVLVDSEPIAYRTFSTMLKENGYIIPDAEFTRLFLGYSIPKCIETVKRVTGKDVPDSFADEYYRVLFEEFRKNLKPVPGIMTAIERLPCPFCVASSGTHEKMRLTLGITGLLPHCDGRIFSATDVERGKPYPDLFLYAAGQCHVDPAQCAVIEDAVPGVQAARSAGMDVFGYTGLCSVQNAAHLVEAGAKPFSSMEELPDLLKGNCMF